VVADRAGEIPMLAMSHPKIQYAWMWSNDVGYGRKANYAINLTRGKYIWLLNDDVFVGPGCGQRLIEVLESDRQIGMVGHELRYPDGTLQHGGTCRLPGALAYTHMDTKLLESRIKEPVEMENVTGASIMMRRRAFEDAGGFFEDYHMYLEDQHLCLAMRRKGWKIFYTPHAKAVHLEHASLRERPGMTDKIRHSWTTFQKHWSWYFKKNEGNPGMGVFE